MQHTDEADLADRLTLRRARASIVLGVFFLISLGGSLGQDVAARPEALRLAAWVVWGAALLFLVAVGGGLLRNSTVRGMMNDDTTRENRKSAMVTGFLVMVVTAFGLYGLNQVAPLSGGDAIRILLTVAISSAAIRFGRLEQRSLLGQ